MSECSFGHSDGTRDRAATSECLPPQPGYYRPMGDELFVPEDFAVPDGLIAGEFRLAPLGPQHNEADYAAWTASMDHIRATPGFPNGSWPHEMSLSDNLRDLERHAQDFAGRRGFTYTVRNTKNRRHSGYLHGAYLPRSAPAPGTLSAACTSTRPAAITPAARAGRHASVRSWVRADRAALDPVLHDAVLAWVERDWPFDSIQYAPRT